MIRNQEIPEEIKNLVSEIESKKLKIVDVKLPNLTGYSSYEQFLRVQDVNVVLSENHFKITPFRVLIHKTNKSELKLNLPVPEFVKNFESISDFMIDDEIVLAPAVYSDYISVEPTEEDLNPIPVLKQIKTEQEPVKIKSLNYLVDFFNKKTFVETIEKFTIDFVNEEISKNPNAFKTIQ